MLRFFSFYIYAVINFHFHVAGEVEEQLELLEELVPDWIHKKAVSSGDFLYWQVSITSVERERYFLRSNNHIPEPSKLQFCQFIYA